MWSQADRRDAAVLALLLALFGFVGAPLLHGLTHAHGHAHHHQGQAPDRHAGASLEHFTLATFAPPPAFTGLVARLEVRKVEQAEPVAASLAERRRSEQSQGPPARG